MLIKGRLKGVFCESGFESGESGYRSCEKKVNFLIKQDYPRILCTTTKIENIIVQVHHCTKSLLLKNSTSHQKASPPAYLKRLGYALITNFLLFFLLVYVNTGFIFYLPLDQLQSVAIEFLFVYLFLVSLLWSHSKIAQWIRLPVFKDMAATKKSIIEALLVIAVTLVLHFLVIYLPIDLILGFENTPEGRVRTVTVISVIISLFFYYFIEREMSRKKLQAEKLRTEQLQKENLKAQLEYLKAQMDPHFLFNSLNVLNSLIYVDPEKASEFTRQLAFVYRSFLDKKGERVVSLKDEMELVKNYVGLLQTRFGSELKFEIQISSDQNELFLPPGAVQLLVENAIKHNGFTEKSPLIIEIYSDGKKLIVSNNLQERKGQVDSVGKGLHNIQSRYEHLSKEDVIIQKTADTFKVTLPLLQKENYDNTDH